MEFVVQGRTVTFPGPLEPSRVRLGDAVFHRIGKDWLRVVPSDLHFGSAVVVEEVLEGEIVDESWYVPEVLHPVGEGADSALPPGGDVVFELPPWEAARDPEPAVEPPPEGREPSEDDGELEEGEAEGG